MSTAACPVTARVMGALSPGDRMALCYMDGAVMNHSTVSRPGPTGDKSTMVVMLAHLGRPTAYVGYWTVAADSGQIEEVPC